MNAIHYDPATGRIASIIQFGSSSLALPLPMPGLEGAFVESNASLPAYFDGTSCVPIGDAPSPAHVFNWAGKQWEDPRTLQDLKDEKWEAIKLERAARESGTFQWAEHIVDADLSRISGAASRVLVAQALGQSYSDTWTLADNSTLPVTGADIFAMGAALGEHISACHAHGRLLRQQIENATSKEEVEAITWNL